MVGRRKRIPVAPVWDRLTFRDLINMHPLNARFQAAKQWTTRGPSREVRLIGVFVARVNRWPVLPSISRQVHEVDLDDIAIWKEWRN